MPQQLQPLPAHPYALFFRMFNATELAKLALRIKADGQLDDIMTVMHNGVKHVLDGRNREAACLMIGKKPRYRAYKGKDPLGYVMSKNADGRRQLTPGEVADAVAKELAIKKAAGVDTPSLREAAKSAGVSRATMQRAADKTKTPKGPAVWKKEDLDKDGELMNAFVSIAAVFGNEHTKAIRMGKLNYKRADVLALAALGADKMKEIHDLVMQEHWTPDKCVRFLQSEPDMGSTNKEMQDYNLASMPMGTEFALGRVKVGFKVFVADIEGFRHFVVPINGLK